jgi:hypothetical protein
MKKNTETLIDASKEVGLEINVQKTKYMLLSRYQNVSKIRDIKIASTYFAAKRRSLGRYSLLTDSGHRI